MTELIKVLTDPLSDPGPIVKGHVVAFLNKQSGTVTTRQLADGLFPAEVSARELLPAKQRLYKLILGLAPLMPGYAYKGPAIVKRGASRRPWLWHAEEGKSVWSIDEAGGGWLQVMKDGVFATTEEVMEKLNG